MKLTSLRGVGPAIAERLTKLHVQHLADLLYYFPTRYDDYSILSPIANSASDTIVTLRGKITKINNRRSWKRRKFIVTDATIQDDSGKIHITWFNQPYIAEQLKVNQEYYVSGKIVTYRGKRSLNNPVFEAVKTETIHTARIVPHYALTEGITQKQLRYFMKQALHVEQVIEWLPETILRHYHLIPLAQALHSIHFPKNWEELSVAKHRLSFDELLIAQLFARSTKASLAKEKAYAIPFPENAIKTLVAQLPFRLTADQKRAAWQIIQDLNLATPMHRLLEGDVGAGKTMVATIAMYTAALAGHQAILMAPTELLAEQHYKTISALLQKTNVSIGLLTGNKKLVTSRDNSRVVPTDIVRKCTIIIGTQALIQKNVQFEKLALAVVDEQHRFGVAQRQRLKHVSGNTAFTPHLLSMTATPIPRSLALVLYGDLEISLLHQPPSGRKPIITRLIRKPERKILYSALHQHVHNHEQIYVVAPRINEDAESVETGLDLSLPVENDVASVEREYKNLKKQFPHARLGKLHGQLSAEEKDQVMNQFRHREIDILITTTVIEVGVDVPNATVMVIEAAEHFGLAQLHQLRGRVGRSDKQSYCYVCTSASGRDRSRPVPTMKRLEYFVNTRDGFALAEYDLQQRGPGAVYGQDQSGYFNQFKLANLHDHELVAQVKSAASDIFPQLTTYPLIQSKLQQFTHQVHLE